ncbi:MAG: leucine-rich repeat domain-containing protein, partial [Hyphomicrobiaceae bacterium]
AGTRVADLAPLAGLASLQSLTLAGTRVADLAPLAGLASLQHLTLAGTPVADLAPLAGLASLQRLWLDGTPVADLAPLAGMTRMIDAVHEAWSSDEQTWRREASGLRFADTPIARTEPFQRLAALEDPARTIETINYLRRQRGWEEHVPRKREPPRARPVLPSQGRAIRFLAPPDGPIDLDRGAPLDKLERDKLGGMQAEMLEAVGELETFARRSNGYAFLMPSLLKYRSALDHPVVDLRDGDIEILYARGIRLQDAYNDLQLEIARGDAPEQDRRLRAPMQVLLSLHGPFLLSTGRGKELFDDTDRDLRARDDDLSFKRKQIELNRALREEARATVTPAAMDENEAATEMIAVGRHPDRAAIAGRGANRNFALALSDKARRARDRGLNVPNITAGVTGGVIANNLPMIGAAVDSVTGMPLAAIAADFMVRHAASYRELALLGGASFDWLRSFIDWLVASDPKSREHE